MASAAPSVEVKLEDKQKNQALKQTLVQIEKAFGKGSIMRMDEAAYLAIPGISTGSISLDLALGGVADSDWAASCVPGQGVHDCLWAEDGTI